MPLSKSDQMKCSKIASQLQRMGDDLNKRGGSLKTKSSTNSSSSSSKGFGKSTTGGLNSKPTGSLFSRRW